MVLREVGKAMRAGLLLEIAAPAILLFLSICFGFTATAFFIGEPGRAQMLRQVQQLDASQDGDLAKESAGATDMLVAEMDPIDQLLSSPSPYEKKKGLLTDKDRERTRQPRKKQKGGSTVEAQAKEPQLQQHRALAPSEQAGTDPGKRAENREREKPAKNPDGEEEYNPTTTLEQADAHAPAGGGEAVDDGKTGKDEKKQPKTIYLFNTAALFPKPITKKTSPQWYRVLQTQKTQPIIFSDGTAARMPPKVAKRWFALREKIKDADDLTKAREVNKFFNTWPYRTDDVVWGVPEYWETPEEFLVKSGDCEGYAITKYFALRSLGIPAEKMRIVAVRETIRGIGHAVLAFFHGDTAYILDNLSARLLDHTVLTNYRPQFSVNEEYRWGHARIVKKKK